MGLEPLDEDKIDWVHAAQQSGKGWLRSLDLVQQGPATCGGDKYFVCSREAVAVAILTGLVHVEAMVGVLDGGHRDARRAQQRQERDEQCRLATARPPDDAQHFQDLAFTFRLRPSTWRARHGTSPLGPRGLWRGRMPQSGNQIVPTGHQSQDGGDPQHRLPNPGDGQKAQMQEMR
jgi:hypothetical protein